MVRTLIRGVVILLAGIGALYAAVLAVFFLSSHCFIAPVMSVPSPSGAYAIDVQRRSCSGDQGRIEVWLRRAGSPDLTGLWKSRPLADEEEALVESSKIEVVWLENSMVKLRVPRNGSPHRAFEVDGARVIYEQR
jgi:hypothetical protein